MSGSSEKTDVTSQRLISFAVTAACFILSLHQLPISLFFTQAWFIAVVALAMLGGKLRQNEGLARALKAFGNGRLISMLAAVALYPSVPDAITLAILHHPIWLLSAYGGFRSAFLFAGLAALQCAVATIQLLDSIPAAAVYSGARRLTSLLPSAAANALKRRIDAAERTPRP